MGNEGGYVMGKTMLSKISNQIMRSLRKDYPVLLHIVGKTSYDKIIPTDATPGSTKLHNVNIVKIEQDRIVGKTYVYCSSWSKLIKIDLQKCWESVAYADEVLGAGGHINIDGLLSIIMNSRHAIMFLE